MRTPHTAESEIGRATSSGEVLWCVLRWGVALFLGIAAVLKVNLWMAEPTRPWFVIAVWVSGEWVLASWLLTGWRPRWVRWLAMSVFGVFAVYNFFLVFRGEVSCGCFGALKVNPMITAVVDLVIVVLFMWVRPGPGPGRFPGELPGAGARALPGVDWRLVGMLVLAMAGAGSMTVVLAANEPARVAPEDQIPDDGKPVLLEPEKWIGKTLPILPHIHMDQDLSRGQWMLVLYHHDCETCIQAIRAISAGTPGVFSVDQTALIEIPPYGAEDHLLHATRRAYPYGRLSEDREWLVASPCIIYVRDGIVVGFDEPRAVANKPVTVKPPPPEPLQAQTQPSSSDAPVDPPASPKPVPVTDKDTFDFGYVEPGSVREVRFVVRNPSDKPAAIQNIHAECICLRPTKPPEVIPAQGQVEILVRLEAPDEIAEYAKRIVLTTDNPELKTVTLTARASIGKPLIVEPAGVGGGAGVEFDVAKVGDNMAQLEVRLTNRGAEPVRLITSTSDVPGIILPVPRVTLQQGETATLRIEVTPGIIPKDKSKAVIRLTTDSEFQRVVVIPVKWR